MKSLRKCLSFALGLALCLSMAACAAGGDKGDNSDGDVNETVIPDSIQDLVIDDTVPYDYSDLWGIWTGEDGSILLIEDYSLIVDGSNRTRYELSDADDNLVTAGDFQYVEEYGCVYAGDQRTGAGHRCWFEGSDTLVIDSFGAFAKTANIPSGHVSDAGDGSDAGYGFLAGMWFRNADPDAEIAVNVYADGSWELLTRPDADEAFFVDDDGIIYEDTELEDTYYAVSSLHDGVSYEISVFDSETIFWDGDYYERLA